MAWLNHGDAAQYLGIDPTTLRRWRDDGFVAFSRRGRTVRYSEADLDEAMRRHEVRHRRQQVGSVCSEARDRATRARRGHLLRIPTQFEGRHDAG